MLNLYEIRQGQGRRWRLLPGRAEAAPGPDQGLYLATAEGKILASHQKYEIHKTWAKEVLADLRPGLKEFGNVEPREPAPLDPLPGRGVGGRKGGGSCLAVFLRYSIKNIPLRELPNPTIDSLVLGTDEFAELAPTKAEPGATWEVSEAVGRKFCRVLGPGDENTMPRPKEVKKVRLAGQVESVKGGASPT